MNDDVGALQSPELRALLARHPRDRWRDAPSGTARLWLDVHDGFRRQCAALRSATDDYRAGKKSTHAYAPLVASSLRALVVHLGDHHQVEDFHYFPLFRSTVASAAGALAALEADHATLTHAMDTALRAVDELVAATRSGAQPHVQRAAATRYIETSETLIARLLRHLSAEEDLVVPLLLDRGGQ